MNSLHQAPVERKNISTPIDLSNLHPELPILHELPATAGGAYLVRRHHIRPELADLLAATIGLGSQELGQ